MYENVFIKQKQNLFLGKGGVGFMIKWRLYSVCGFLTFEMERFIGYGGMIEL